VFNTLGNTTDTLIIPPEKVKPIEEKLLRLKTQGVTALARAADIDKEQLLKEVASVWALLDACGETLAKGKVPRPFLAAIPMAKRALESSHQRIRTEPGKCDIRESTAHLTFIPIKL
jgi:hypothetical protein